MPQISIIKKSDIQEARRFDAEFFKPEYLEIERKLRKIKSEKFGKNLLEITGGATPLGANYYKQGIPFLRVQNIMYNYINDNDIVFISDKQESEIKRSRLKEGDVLLTITGVSYGKSAPVISQHVGSNINQHSVRMKFNERLRPFYISTFLNCKYGKKQSDKNIVGISRPALDYEAIKSFLIPILPRFFQLQIEKIVKSAYQKQTRSKQLYKEAEGLLLKEVDLLDYEPEHILSFETTKKETDEAGRFDAEYFQPKYDEIIKKIEKYKNGFNNLKFFIKDYSTGFPFKSDSYVDKGCYLIRINNIEKGKLNLENANKIPIGDKELSKKDIAKENDILISMSGTIGNACKIPNGIEAVINQRIFRFTPKNFNEEVLTLLINSIVGLTQLNRIGTGGVQINISGNDIQKIKTPLIDLKIQKQIAQKIIESHKLRKESKELLEEAKRKVEEEIEKK